MELFKSKSQNQEDIFVLNYFGDYKGNLLEIGSNDGVTFSNSKLLIEQGWSAWLCEPGLTYYELYHLHKDNINVTCCNTGIGEKEFEVVKFYESGAHVPNGTDRGLVSTTNFEETKRWPDVEFTERDIVLISWDRFYKGIGQPRLDFISIDAESHDWTILKQMDLEMIGCRCLCIEWNSNNELGEKMVNYCKKFDLELKHINAENLIFTK